MITGMGIPSNHSKIGIIRLLICAYFRAVL
jgi:hypothetical protein